MSVHERTTKWFNDCVKREKHRRSKSTLKQEKSVKKEDDHPLPAYFSHCCYCIKVFYDAKFLVKHILRRHSDKLIGLHRNVLTVTKSEKVNYETPDLYEFLKAEFSDLKVEVDFIKKAISDHMQEKSDSVAESKSYLQPSNDKKDSHLDSTSNSALDDSMKNKLDENGEAIVSNQISTADFHNLQVRVDKLFQIIKETRMSKEDIEKALAMKEEMFCKSLKSELLTEIQNILSNYQKENRAEYEVHYGKLQRKVDKLEKAVAVNSKKIESPDCLHEIQSKFESRIQNLLTGHALFTSNSKKSRMDKNQALNEQKQSMHKLKKQTKSIYTSKSVHNKCSDLSGIKQNKSLHSSTSHRRKEKPLEGTSHINKDSALFTPERNHLKMAEQEKLHEFNSIIDNSENFSKKHLKEVKLIVDEKLKSLNIDPSTEKLSNEELEKKIQLINSENELLEKKDDNFSQIRDKLDSDINEVVESKLRRKVPKKLRFSDLTGLSSFDHSDSGSAIKISRTAQKQESSGFILSTDQNAQGDSSYKNCELENLSPIQEDISEGSYTDYPHHSTTPQQNDYDSFMKCLPVSPVGYVVENRTAKKTSNFLLQKSVEEMSDLSSLESDILEDEIDNLKGTV